MDQNLLDYLKLIAQNQNTLIKKFDDFLAVHEKSSKHDHTISDAEVDKKSAMQYCEERVFVYWNTHYEPMALCDLSRNLSKSIRVKGSMAEFLRGSDKLAVILSGKNTHLLLPKHAYENMSQREREVIHGPKKSKLSEARAVGNLERMIQEGAERMKANPPPCTDAEVVEYCQSHPHVKSVDMHNIPKEVIAWVEARRTRSVTSNEIAGKTFDAFTVGALPPEMIAKQVDPFILE